MRSERVRTPRPARLLRLLLAGGAAATAVAVASAALDLGRGHWGAALVALPLLVAAVADRARRLSGRLPRRPLTASALLLVAIATGGLVGWSGDARWAVGLHVAAAGVGARGGARRARRLVPRRAGSRSALGATTSP